jgi:hypothetical protein
MTATTDRVGPEAAVSPLPTLSADGDLDPTFGAPECPQCGQVFSLSQTLLDFPSELVGSCESCGANYPVLMTLGTAHQIGGRILFPAPR